MNKTLLIFILGLFSFSYKTDSKSQDIKVEVKLKKSDIRKELRFSLYISTEFNLKEITVGLPDTVLTYKKSKKNTQTEWVNIESAYHYGFVRFFDMRNRKYNIQPIDYVGETAYKVGELKFIIKSIDTINNNFELDFDYNHN